MKAPERTAPAFGSMTAEEYRKQTVGDFRATPRAGKFNAQRMEYDGALYDSKGEARFAETLDWKLKAKKIQGYDRQVRIDLIAGIYMVMDFVVLDLDGTKHFIDYKGVETPVFKLKRRLFEHIHSPAKIEVVRG